MPNLTIPEAAAAAKCSEKTIRRHIQGYYISKGERYDIDRLPTRQMGRRGYLIDSDELSIFLNRHNDDVTYRALMRKYEVRRPVKNPFRKVA